MSQDRTPWPKHRVDDLCLEIVDCVNRTAPVVDGPTPFRMIRTTNVRNGVIDLNETRFVDEDTFKTWTRRQVPLPGDVILTREAPLGEVGMIRPGANVFLGQRLVSYRTDPNLLDNRYLLYYLQSPAGKAQVQSFGMGSTVAHMRVPDAKNLLIPTPPLDTQRRIASILGGYDDLIEINRRRVAVLEEMARGLFEEWFVRFRFPGHDSVPLVDTPDGPLPQGWSLEEFGQLIDLPYGKALKATDRVPGNIPVIGSSGVVGTHVEAYSRGPGIVLGRKGNVGSVIWSPTDFWPIDTVFFVRSDWPQMFLLQLLHRVPFQNTDAAVPGLNRTAALKKKVTVPPLSLAEAFEHAARPMRDLVDQLQSAIERLAASRDLLLPRLMSGQLSIEAAERNLELAA